MITFENFLFPRLTILFSRLVYIMNGDQMYSQISLLFKLFITISTLFLSFTRIGILFVTFQGCLRSKCFLTHITGVASLVCLMYQIFMVCQGLYRLKSSFTNITFMWERAVFRQNVSLGQIGFTKLLITMGTYSFEVCCFPFLKIFQFSFISTFVLILTLLIESAILVVFQMIAFVMKMFSLTPWAV